MTSTLLGKLVKRFIELRDFLREHKNETIHLQFDINEKLGVEK